MGSKGTVQVCRIMGMEFEKPLLGLSCAEMRYGKCSANVAEVSVAPKM